MHHVAMESSSPKLSAGKLICGCGASYLDIDGMASKLELSRKSIINRRSNGTMPEALAEHQKLLKACYQQSSGTLRRRLRAELARPERT